MARRAVSEGSDRSDVQHAVPYHGRDPFADISLHVPQQCANRGLVANDGFLPGLLPYGLTRGGAPFAFDGRGRIHRMGVSSRTPGSPPLGPDRGSPADVYDGLSRATGVQPRFGRSIGSIAARRSCARRTAASPHPVKREFDPASSTGSGGFGGGLPGSVGGAPLTPGRRHQYDVGVQQKAWRGIRIDAEYFWKFTDGAYDFDLVLNTPLAFPVQFRQSRQNGGLGPIDRTRLHGLAVIQHVVAHKFAAVRTRTWGLRFSADYAAVARPDHDEPFQQNTHLEYRSTRKLGFWGGLTWRYDSGLVAVAVPTYGAACALPATSKPPWASTVAIRSPRETSR